MNKKLIVLLLAAVLLLSACGSGAATAPADASAPAAAQEAASGPASGQENAGSTEEDPLAEMKQKAEAGDTQAMKDLAWRYWGHEGVEKDMDQCAAWYEKAIEAGDTEAMTTLAWLCWGNEGMEKDMEKSVALYEKAVEAGVTEAMRTLAWLYRGNQDVARDMEKTVALYEKAAEAGDAESMRTLGWLYRGNDGLEKDMDKAVAWYEKAAEAGDTEAMRTLGWLYEGNDGVEKDMDKAVGMYAKAVEAGDMTAVYTLGLLYEMRLDPPDPAKAAEYYGIGAGAGQSGCMDRLNSLYRDGKVSRPTYEEAVLAYNEAAKDRIPDPELVEKPVFHTVDADGNPADESVFAGHALTMVIFWAGDDVDSSGFFHPRIPFLEEMQEKYADQGLQVLGVCENTTYENGSSRFLSSEEVRERVGDVNFKNLLAYRPSEDGDSELQSLGTVSRLSIGGETRTRILAQYDVGCIPSAIFVDGEGRLVHFPLGVSNAAAAFNQISPIVKDYHSFAGIYGDVYDNTLLFEGVKQLAEISLCGTPTEKAEPLIAAYLNGERPGEEELAWWDSLHHDSELEWWGRINYKG